MIILCFAFFEDLLNSFLQQLPCIFFEEMSTQDICPFFQDQIKSGTFRVVWLFLMPIFKSICCCFCCGSWIVGVLLCISGYYFLIRWIICKYFLPFNRPPFHFLKSILSCTELQIFDIQFIYVLLLFPVLLVSYTRNNFHIQYHKTFPLFSSESYSFSSYV